MLILGIDPGTATTGFGVIRKTKHELEFVDCGCILTKPSLSLPERLNIIARDLKKIVRDYKPEVAAVEELFFFKNLKTALAVGHARGVVLQILEQAQVSIFEFTPLEIKQALTGYGRADKKQMQKMVQMILKLGEIPRPDDAADALAAAITLSQYRNLTKL